MNDQKFVSRIVGHKLNVSKYHDYQDCSAIRHATSSGFELLEVTDREVDLLGLSECSQCQKRKTGGPAIEALKEIVIACNFGEPSQESPEGDAWRIFNGLKERGFYIASRRNNQEVKAVKEDATS